MIVRDMNTEIEKAQVFHPLVYSPDISLQNNYKKWFSAVTLKNKYET